MIILYWWHTLWPAPSYSEPLSPVWMPARSCSLWSGMWGMETCLTAATRSSAILAISSACLSPFLSGRPLTTMYASPIVSTWFDRCWCFGYSLDILFEQNQTESSCMDTWTNQDDGVICEKLLKLAVFIWAFMFHVNLNYHLAVVAVSIHVCPNSYNICSG